MTCEDVEPLLDLLAADACDPPTREAVESHLRQCEACAASYAESQRVQGLLDLQMKKDGLERLQRRIEEAARPRRRINTFVQRVAAVAALVLLVVGLIWWLPRGTEPTEPQFALLVRAGKTEVNIVPQLPDKLNAKDAEVMVKLPAFARDGNKLRDELAEAQRNGKLPLPPEVHLELTLVNNGKRPVEIRLGDADAKLSLDSLDKGVVRLAAPKAETPDLLRSQSLHVAPGKQLVFPIDRLIAGSPGNLEYVYFTEPGAYSFTPSLRLTADGQPITVTGTTVRIHVLNPQTKTP